ncbi:MAG TPA: hypothetical protein VGF34_00185 [Stellaceae bacterium]|jgi:hypothetical protein
MKGSIGVRAGVVAGALLLAGAGAAKAQMPPPSEAAAVNACLCLQQGLAALSSDMNAKTQALAAIRQHLADLDNQLSQARPTVQVNNPDSVARYKALLDQRDAAYKQSTGPVVAQADQAVARYNAHVNQYNQSCANHPFDAAMMAEMQAHLSCPPLQ